MKIIARVHSIYALLTFTVLVSLRSVAADNPPQSITTEVSSSEPKLILKLSAAIDDGTSRSSPKEITVVKDDGAKADAAAPTADKDKDAAKAPKKKAAKKKPKVAAAKKPKKKKAKEAIVPLPEKKLSDIDGHEHDHEEAAYQTATFTPPSHELAANDHAAEPVDHASALVEPSPVLGDHENAAVSPHLTDISIPSEPKGVSTSVVSVPSVLEPLHEVHGDYLVLAPAAAVDSSSASVANAALVLVSSSSSSASSSSSLSSLMLISPSSAIAISPSSAVAISPSSAVSISPSSSVLVVAPVADIIFSSATPIAVSSSAAISVSSASVIAPDSAVAAAPSSTTIVNYNAPAPRAADASDKASGPSWRLGSSPVWLNAEVGAVGSSWSKISPAFGDGSWVLGLSVSQDVMPLFSVDLGVRWIQGMSSANGANDVMSGYDFKVGGRYKFMESRVTPFVQVDVSLGHYTAWESLLSSPSFMVYKTDSSGTLFGVTPGAGVAVNLSQTVKADLGVVYMGFFGGQASNLSGFGGIGTLGLAF